MNEPLSQKTPRLESLHHRLETAKDTEGNPLPRLDELMVFLEDPPPGTTDRWQAGADLCRGWGIETSRVGVWRCYQSHVLDWRLQNAAETVPDPKALAALQEKARWLAALRTCESLANPRLAPAQVIGLAQIEHRRQALDFTRQKFQAELRRRTSERAYRDITYDLGQDGYLDWLKKFVASLPPVEQPISQPV